MNVLERSEWCIGFLSGLKWGMENRFENLTLRVLSTHPTKIRISTTPYLPFWGSRLCIRRPRKTLSCVQAERKSDFIVMRLPQF